MRKYLKTVCMTLFVSALFIQTQQGLSITRNSDEDSSKTSSRIAIAAVSDSVNSEISEKAGRAPYYLVFEGDGVFLKHIENPSQNRRGGASTGVVDLLINESVITVIAGKFGEKMKIQLKTNKIEYHECAGIVKEIVEKYIKNKGCKNVQK